MIEIPRGIRYEVRLPDGSGRATKLRRVFNWLRSPLAAAEEINEAHVELQARYEQLELAKQDLEKRVIERTAELQATTTQLAGTVRALEEAKEVRDRIFANVNHDLRSPLSLILLTVSELRSRGGLAPATERSIGAVEHGARRVLRMVDELLILAEGREGAVRLWMASVDLGAMVRAFTTWPSTTTSTPTVRHLRTRRSRSTCAETSRPPGGEGSTNSSAVERRVRSSSRTFASSTQRKPLDAVNVPRPTTTLACASVRESVSGRGASSSMRCRSASAS